MSLTSISSNQTVSSFFSCEWNMAAIWHPSSALLSWTLAVTQEICTPLLIREPAKAISHDIAEILLLLTLSASVTKPRWSYLLYSQTVNHSIFPQDPPSAALQPLGDAVKWIQSFIYIHWWTATSREFTYQNIGSVKHWKKNYCQVNLLIARMRACTSILSWNSCIYFSGCMYTNACCPSYVSAAWIQIKTGFSIKAGPTIHNWSKGKKTTQIDQARKNTS